MAASYTVTLETPDGSQSFDCADDEFILDRAEEEDMDLPYSCRAGCCSSCAGMKVAGSVDQDEQTFLDDDEVDKGYCLMCVSYPTSDVTIRTHCEGEL